MNGHRFTFRRPALAQQICAHLSGEGLMDARSGLFLAAPRRTGKSVFLREDLIPATEQREWVPVYVDLWADRSRDPALLIADAIKARIQSYQSILTKMAKAAGLEKVSLFNALSLHLQQPGLPEHVTLADALEALQMLAKRPVALIVDEAQHALQSDAGLNAMFALKAARDHLNQGVDVPRLCLVFTGSNRDKLAQLVHNRKQPFFGSRITPFPLLSKEFTDALTCWVNSRLASDNQFDPEDVFAAFRLVGHRPEPLRDIIGQVALETGAASLGTLLRHGAQEWRDRIWGDIQGEFDALPPLQRAVLSVLIEQGPAFAPFSEDIQREYARLLGHTEFTTASIQSALDGLRERGLVWREGRGAYVLEDDSLALWYRQSRSDSEGSAPPGPASQ